MHSSISGSHILQLGLLPAFEEKAPLLKVAKNYAKPSFYVHDQSS